MAAERVGKALSITTRVGWFGKNAFRDGVEGQDKNDFPTIRLSNRSSTQFSLSRFQVDGNLQLLNSKGQVILSCTGRETLTEAVKTTLNSGTYYLRIYKTQTDAASAPIGYTPSALADSAGNTLNTARVVSVGSTARSYRDWIGNTDTRDFYRINLNSPGTLNLSLRNLASNANMRLLSRNGAVIQTSANSGSSSESIRRLLNPGTYYVQIYPGSRGPNTNYTLSLSKTAASSINTSLNWTRQFGTPGNERSESLSLDSAGNVYVAGTTQGSLGGTNAGGQDAWIAKYDNGGNRVWIKQFGTSAFDSATDTTVDTDGNVYITGATNGSLEGTSAGSNDAWVAKYNSAGNRVWIRQLGTPSVDSSFSVATDNSGNVYIAGNTNGSLDGTNAGATDIFVAKYTSNGTLLWTKQIGTPTSDQVPELAVDTSGNVYVTANTYGALAGSNAGDNDVFIAKYRSDGTLSWTKQLGTSAYDNVEGITIDDSDNIYISGGTDGSLGGSNAGSRDAWLGKYTSDGTLLWTRQIGTSGFETSTDITVSPTGSIYIGGYGSLGASQVWLAKYSSNGNAAWRQELAIAGNAYALNLAVDIYGNAYVGGGTSGAVEGRNVGLLDSWLAKYQIDQAGNTFNPTYGYGLVNAATAVGMAIGQFPFANVPDLGGNNWSNDLVKAPEAWARGYTGQGITVAVIDSGVDITHPDLAANIWRNTDEIAGNRIDDDNNGYIDDVNGWNFGANNNNVRNGSMSVSRNGHGTHVAGTIAGINNGFGVTGVAYQAKIMPIKIGDVSSSGIFINPGNLARSIRYAVDNGARVINMSVGWFDSPELASAMAYAASRNVITVSSAGNSATPSPGIPASYAIQYGISVGAVSSNRTIASFSNRAGLDSSMRHFVAPGVGIYSTLPGSIYASWQGTSMAAPHVAGVIALMLDANPNLTSGQIRQILTNSSTGLNSSSQTSTGSGTLVDILV